MADEVKTLDDLKEVVGETAAAQAEAAADAPVNETLVTR